MSPATPTPRSGLLSASYAKAESLGAAHSGRRVYRAIPAAAALGALTVGTGVLLGWAYGPVMPAAGPFAPVGTVPLTATAILLLGGALWLLRPRDGVAPNRRGAAPGRLAAATACLLALAVGVEWSTGISLGIDHLFFPHTVGAVASSLSRFHGRMSLTTTGTVLLLGLSLLLLDARALVGSGVGARLGRVARWACTGTALLIPYFAVVGYLFGVQWLYNPSGLLAGMALDTAIGLTLVAVGVSLARPARGVARLLAGDDPGAVLLRRTLPVAITLPLVLGILRIRGESLGYVTPQVGVAATILALTIALVTTLTRAGAAAYRVAADRARVVAEREAAREALQRSEVEFREMADNLPQLAWMADAAGNKVWFNRRWYDYTGTAPEAMTGGGWQAAHHPDHVARVTAGFQAAVHGGTPWEDTFPLRAADGEWRWFLSRANPIRGTDGAVLRWFGTNTDVTAQRALEAERERLLDAERRARADAERAGEAAAAASHAKSQFLATMSHELRTPLNAISGHVQLVELGLHGPVTDAQRDALNRAQRAQRHLLGLINDVLNLARIEAGRVEYHPEPVNATDLAADVASLVEPQLAGRALTFTVDAPPAEHAPEAWADRDKTSQILLNLLGNAGKFTDAGGHVTLEVRAEDGPTGPVVLFRVRDTGRGIALADRVRIFEPFVQLDAGYARQQEGTGLGLAISRDLARGMGGDLTLATTAAPHDSPGHGSTFVLSLPRLLAPDVSDRRTGEERRDGQRREAADRRSGEDRREEPAATPDA